ncbi:MAG: hypothetical protein GQ569_13745, partial [Methylococcaceae bacterium]|nr:hypothetical protein [Methylococcaceae bacterium]
DELNTLLADQDNPIGLITANAYNDIRFVQVSITNNDVNPLSIPGISASFIMPTATTTLPSESLGRVSLENPINKRCCYGFCDP